MKVERGIEPNSLERGGRRTGAWLLCARVVVATVTVGALAYAVPKAVRFFSSGGPTTSMSEPVVFAQRFPVELAAPSQDYQRDAKLQLARGQLAEAMHSLASQAPPEGPSMTAAASPKLPLPKSRPVAASLMADYGAVGDTKQAATTGPFDVSAAIRNVFAMLPPNLKLASASPDGGIAADGQDRAPDLTVYGKQTALYDITARTVYMPDGSRLEAHSGLGELMDDVRFVHVHDRGPTPPNVYELSFREKTFHGVKALRMKAVGESELFGRAGLLVHSHLMGPNGDSNGCVSIKDYDAFKKAFSDGAVKRLVVVKSVRDDAIKVARKT
jgi:hypothetical protein